MRINGKVSASQEMHDSNTAEPTDKKYHVKFSFLSGNLLGSFCSVSRKSALNPKECEEADSLI